MRRLIIHPFLRPRESFEAWLLNCWQHFHYRSQRSCGKVMFLHLSVNPPPRTATVTDSTHPTGMHSCLLLLILLNKCVVIVTVVRRVLIGWSHIRPLGKRHVFPVGWRIDGGRISSRWGRVVWPRYRVMWLARGIVGYTGRRVGRWVTMSTWNKGMILRITSNCNTCLTTVLTKLKIAIWS